MRFHPRGRIEGTITLVCPACGLVNRHQNIKPQVWKIRCRNPDCRKTFVHGLILWECTSGNHRSAWDRMVPGTLKNDKIEVLPVVPVLSGWSSGKSVNRVVWKPRYNLHRMVKLWRRWYRWRTPSE